MAIPRDLVATFLLFAFIACSVNCQGYRGADVSERCGTGCITPGKCSYWQFYRRNSRQTPFRYCCYDQPRRRSHRNSRRVKKLDCRFRQIENFVTTEVAPDVQSLDLGFNEFEGKAQQLRDDFLQYFQQLHTLSISLSHLSNLTSNFLSANRALKDLILSWNSITELPEDLLAENSELVQIDLSGNKISILPKNFFQHNPNIERILLSHNHLKYLTSEHFTPVPNLRLLDISHNQKLECLSPTVFANNKKIGFLRLEKTGYHVPIGMQKTYCERACGRYTMAYLEIQFEIYFTGRPQHEPDHPCFDPAPWRYAIEWGL